MQSIPQAHLGSSDKIMMPAVGFGTAEFPFGANDSVKQSVLQAIEVGYRHFDTAELYQSEQALGDAIAEALRGGLVKSRDELFVTSKVFCYNAHCHLVLPSLKTTLKKLGLEYLDLYLIHFPASLKPEAQFPFNKDDILPMDLESVWKAMEECHDLGLAKSIGVSNFSCKKIEKLLTTARIPPAVNQVEMNPHWQQKKLKEFCDKKGIHLTAYAPLGAKGAPWGSNRVLECDVLDNIAKAKGKTVAQVCLRWAFQQGVSLVVKSFNRERMKQNLDIFDWKLSAEELEKIAQIPQRRGSLAEMFVTEDGPYKSLMDLWDGEM